MALSHNEETRDAALRLYAAGLDQPSIAAALRVAQSTVSRWLGALDGESARKLANASDLRRLIDETETGGALRADEFAAAITEAAADWNEPSGVEHLGCMHAMAGGSWVCFDTETGRRVTFV